MPNWCDNRIFISGPTEELQRFMTDTAYTPDDERDGNARMLTRLVPMPKALEGTTSPTPDSTDPHPNWVKMLNEGQMTQEWYDHLCEDMRKKYEQGQAAKAATGYANWWDWQISHWGVKWGDSETHLAMQDGNIVGTFMTPWAPPVQGMIRISSQYPALSFTITWSEEGGSHGQLIVREGKLLKNDEYDWVPPLPV